MKRNFNLDKFGRYVLCKHDGEKMKNIGTQNGKTFWECPKCGDVEERDQ